MDLIIGNIHHFVAFIPTEWCNNLIIVLIMGCIVLRHEASIPIEWCKDWTLVFVIGCVVLFSPNCLWNGVRIHHGFQYWMHWFHSLVWGINDCGMMQEFIMVFIIGFVGFQSLVWSIHVPMKQIDDPLCFSLVIFIDLKPQCIWNCVRIYCGFHRWINAYSFVWGINAYWCMDSFLFQY